ncbi:MAG: N-acetylmuramoyl-L-alanine amidase [Oceanicaulis sp.]
MQITDRPSPNFNERAARVSILVLHYTGMDDAEAAIERLCDPDAGVSSHYVVDEEGAVTRLVAEDKRAWHAGAGAWRGQADVNSASVGIEIVNGGHCYGLPAFPDAQVEAVITLSQAILARHEIKASGVIGHSDLAPERKLDPGERFPWRVLARAGIGVWPERVAGDRTVRHAPGRGSGETLLRLQDHLRAIGYAEPGDGDYTARTRAVVAAFQRRFRASVVDGLIDGETATLIEAVARLTRDA